MIYSLMNFFSGTSLEEAINTRSSVVIDEEVDPDSNNMEENMKKANITEM